MSQADDFADLQQHLQNEAWSQDDLCNKCREEFLHMAQHEPVTLQVDLMNLTMLVSAVQLALRHPRYPKESSRLVRGMAEQIIELLQDRSKARSGKHRLTSKDSRKSRTDMLRGKSSFRKKTYHPLMPNTLIMKR